MSDQIVAALISALVSALVSAVAIFFTVRNSRKQREHEAAQEEKKARRDYEYEARKHLYSEIQPLLFQLKELSESAYRWVISLARTARQGQLSWLSKGYYLSMTIYRFTAPLAVFRLIHGRLTIVDFSVDRPIRVQYNIAKQSYLSISDGFSIATAGKDQGIDLKYEPHELQRRRRRGPFIPSVLQRRRRRGPFIPSVHAQQHLFRGHLDMIADALVVREPDGPRCMTYGEFEVQFKDSRSDVHRATRALADGFREFEPQSRPVVWRMLIVQMYFHKALLHTFDTETYEIGSPADLLSKEERPEFDWRCEDARKTQKPPDREVLEWPFVAAEEYVGKQLRGFFTVDACASTPQRRGWPLARYWTWWVRSSHERPGTRTGGPAQPA